MELIAPADVQLDEVTTAMLSDVDELARQVNEIRPLARRFYGRSRRSYLASESSAATRSRAAPSLSGKHALFFRQKPCSMYEEGTRHRKH